MKNILVIKTNASGDVVRTTVLLRILTGRIFWITAAYNIPLFPDNYPDLVLIPAENIPTEILAMNFDMVMNLEEDAHLARLVMTVGAKKTIGILWREGKLDYTRDSAEWFDMSLISKLSLSEADDLKKANRSSYQEILFRMVGENFSGQKYLIYQDNKSTKPRYSIGIEPRVGHIWPNKSWHGYDELIKALYEKKQSFKVFQRRTQLREYLDDINECGLIVCGDTLAMHVALAYSIPCIALFNCTSATEIFDYGVLTKITSPLLFEAFYKRNSDSRVVQSISFEEVYDKVEIQTPANQAGLGK